MQQFQINIKVTSKINYSLSSIEDLVAFQKQILEVQKQQIQKVQTMEFLDLLVDL
jgi:hypothetical protein